MAKRSYSIVFFLLLLAAMLVLSACGGRAFGSADFLPVERIENTVVARSIQYQDGLEEGPLYNFSVEVPESFVGVVQTRSQGNRIVFEFVVAEENGPIPAQVEPLFVIEALSQSQYWEQIGSYPGQFETLVNAYDTYFVVQQAIDDFYTGIDEFMTAVPDQITLPTDAEVVGDPLSDVEATAEPEAPEDSGVSVDAQSFDTVRAWISTYMPSIRSSFAVARAEPLQ